MLLSLIVAVAENQVIGKNNSLVWHMPTDMKYFMEKTKGHCVITGRKNYESIPDKYRPLRDRSNLVVTRKNDYSAPGAKVFNSIEEAIDFAKKTGESETFVIGGADVYRQTLEKADRIYLTRIHHSFDGDAFFPEIDQNKWKNVREVRHAADEKNPHDYTFFVFDKI